MSSFNEEDAFDPWCLVKAAQTCELIILRGRAFARADLSVPQRLICIENAEIQSKYNARDQGKNGAQLLVR